MFDKLIEEESKISNCKTLLILDEFIIALVLYFRLISIDMSSVETFILKVFDKYVELSNKRIILLKYLQLIIAKILTNDKFKEIVADKFTKV